jgi:hypothetical protein
MSTAIDIFAVIGVLCVFCSLAFVAIILWAIR